MTEKYDYCSSVPSWGLLSGIVALEWKERALIEKVNSRYFWWFLAAMLAVHQYGVSIQSSTKVCRTCIAANDSESVVYKDLRLGQIGYILVFYIISFSWLLPLDSFASLCEKTIYQKHYSDLDSDVLLVWNVYQMSFYDENNGNAVRCVENCKFFNYVIIKFLYSRVKRLLFYHI